MPTSKNDVGGTKAQTDSEKAAKRNLKRLVKRRLIYAAPEALSEGQIKVVRRSHAPDQTLAGTFKISIKVAVTRKNVTINENKHI